MIMYINFRMVRRDEKEYTDDLSLKKPFIMNDAVMQMTRVRAEHGNDGMHA